MECKILIISLALALLRQQVVCKRASNIFVERKLPGDDLPSCTYEAQGDYGGDVVCVYLHAKDMDLLVQALQEVSDFVPEFGVDIEFSDGESIPVGVFAGFNITHAVFSNCNFSEIPYEMLSSIESLTYLEIEYNNFTIVEASPTDIFLPFSEFLTVFAIEETDLRKIDSAVFEQYSNLQILHLDNNDLDSIGLELIGVETLQEIYYDANGLFAIETGAFRDLANLQYLNLSYNEISTLQDDAFMGLETSPIYGIGLSANPWNCTCDLQWLKDWLNERNLTDASGAECAYPIVGNFNDIEFC